MQLVIAGALRSSSERANRRLSILLATLSVAVMAGCGGGGGGVGEPSPPIASLNVEITDAGTFITCESDRPATFELVRLRDAGEQASAVSCPGFYWNDGDYLPSRWKLRWNDSSAMVEVAVANSALPAPVLLQDGDRIVLASASPVQALAGWNAELITQDGNSAVLSEGGSLQALGGQDALKSAWRWRARQGDAEFLSDARQASRPTTTDLGYWGALTVGDSNGDGSVELLGSLSGATGMQAITYDALGLSPLFENRVFRDVRLADLDGDGHDDIVANVYNGGCTLIGLFREGEGFVFSLPTRQDGSCISGHGETILVADFDGDGRLDIFLPSYERFDFLRNLGNGRFEEISERLGISFPNYLPKVEGASAVDIDLDGDVDIVVVNEVLLNDGQGRFVRLENPFGLPRIFDEGLSVFDLDADGRFDIVKNHPSRGLRIYWGQPQRTVFQDGGWVFGGEPVINSSYGIAAGHFSGNKWADVLIAGGLPEGQGPVLCLQASARNFDCLREVFPDNAGAFQDLLMLNDLDANGSMDLVARFGTLHTYNLEQVPRYAFRVQLVDKDGLRNMQGRTLRAVCAWGETLVGLRAVDGGNGFMAQSDYTVALRSEWCPAIYVDVATPAGMERHGPLPPGDHTIRVVAGR